jgi:hypothetical protein
MMNLSRSFHCLLDRFGPARRLQIVAGDELPSSMPSRDIVLTRDDGEAWSVGMLCPCRCGATIEMLVVEGAKPRWDIEVDDKGRPSLRPSIWRNTGCRSHFWIRSGRVVWCKSRTAS